ncbi:MAG: hypothetical protein HYV68_03470, partial [Candidatus Taylorbacteria bacterium]|nr:hypothetical protein [Candidatus Taylorbacteria bacterium]
MNIGIKKYRFVGMALVILFASLALNLIFLALPEAHAASSDWNLLQTGTTINAIKSLGPEVWIGGLGGFLYKSTDSGSTWTPSPSSTGGSDIRGMFFVDSNTGYAVGTGGKIRKTTDGGLSWAAQNSNTTSNLNAIFCRSTSLCWAVGEINTIRKTSDGGATWTMLTSGGSSSTTWLDVFFSDDTNGVIGGNFGGLRYTTNGGST